MIIIYGTPSCTQCSQAKAMLETFDVPYEYRDATDTGVLTELCSYMGTVPRSVPQIFFSKDDKRYTDEGYGYIGGLAALQKIVRGLND